MQERYDKCTPMTISWEKIYQDCVNIEFWKGGVRHPGPVREIIRIDKSKYSRFHKVYDHNTDDCIQLKDVIEGLVNRGLLTRYVKEGQERS